MKAQAEYSKCIKKALSLIHKCAFKAILSSSLKIWFITACEFDSRTMYRRKSIFQQRKAQAE